MNEEDCRTLELLAVLLSSAVSEAAEREARREQVEALVRFETIFEQAPIGIGLVSLDGRLVNTNSVMRDISGRSAEELASRNVGEYTVPEDVDRVVELFVGMLQGEHDSYRHEHRLYHKDGEVVWVDSATALLRDADGKPQGAVSMAQNITRRRAAEEQLRQSQKIDAIGQLAGGHRARLQQPPARDARLHASSRRLRSTPTPRPSTDVGSIRARNAPRR